MATYTLDSTPHATAVADSKARAVREAFEKILEYNNRGDIKVVSIESLGVNPEHSHNVPAFVFRIKYDPNPNAISGTADAEPTYKKTTADVSPVRPSGEPVTKEDFSEMDPQWEASIVDQVRHLDD